MEHLNSWKNKKVFEEQLKLNLKELNPGYPSHWEILLKFIGLANTFSQAETGGDPRQIRTFLDVGCGCGAISKLILNHYPYIRYTGIDYAPEAIEIASKQWPAADFFVKDYRDLTKEYTDQFDIVHACSLHNVLPNGDEALDFLLSLKPKFLILGKLLVTDKESHYETYTAYDLITTYKYYHNYQELCNKLNGFMEEEKEGYVCHYLLGRSDV